MYTMGHKALVLNSLPDGATISIDQSGFESSIYKIPGFCNFSAGEVLSQIDEAAVVGVNEISTYVAVIPSGLAVGDTVSVEVTFKQGGRYVSEYSSDFIKQGDTIIFQSAKVAAATATGVAVAIAAGWTAYLNVFNVAQDPPLNMTTTGTTNVTVTATQFYIGVESVIIKNVPAGAKTVPAAESKLIQTIATPGTEGNGQGKFLEESIRTASYTNMDPYANKPHGSDSVDIRGSYRMVEITGSDNAAWEPHENLGTAIADQNVTVKPQKYTLYLNEAFSWTEIA